MSRRAFAWAVLLWVLLPSALIAQERWLRGKVVRQGEHGETIPEVNLTVRIEEAGNTDTTTSGGLFRIMLPDVFKPGDRVTLHIDKPGWRIHLPVAGETRVFADLQKELVEVRLLPVGSPLFLSHHHLEKLVQDLAEKSKQQLTVDNKPVDFSRAIKDWAVKYGFSAQQAKAEIDKWIAEVKANEDDPAKLGLAAFAEKKFGQASQLFTTSAEQKTQRLAEVRHEEDTLIEEIVRDFRRAGDAHANNYRFDAALSAYERALSYVTKAHKPQLWAATLTDIGGAHWQRGIRTTGTAIHDHLTAATQAYRQALEVRTRTDLPQDWATTQNNLGNALADQGNRTAGERGTQLLAEAVTAYRQALEVFTRTDLPQQWATTQNNLGNALADQGRRTAGERGTQLLAEAVTAYRQALEVRTRTDLPQDWATTQNNLGITLVDQGRRTAGERGTQLLAEAVAAYRQALEVRTRTDLPQQWAQTQNNLANTLLLLQDWPNAALSYVNVLHVYPDDRQAYQTASYLYHERLFQFPEAFTVNQQWIERHPDDLAALSDFAEKHFTTERFAECAQRLAALLAHPDMEPQVRVALQAITIANLLALDKATGVPDAIDTMLETIGQQPEDFQVTWTFQGTLYFIRQYMPLAPYRDWLQQWFHAFAATDRQSTVMRLEVNTGKLPCWEKVSPLEWLVSR